MTCFVCLCHVPDLRGGLKTPVRLQVFDSDIIKDDELGESMLDLSMIKPGVQYKVKVPLNLQGSITLSLTYTHLQ